MMLRNRGSRIFLIPFVMLLSFILISCIKGERGKDGLNGTDLTAGGDPAVLGTGLHLINGAGYYPSNHLEGLTDAAHDDPKVTRTAGKITYQLDDVADLKPGTYVAFIEAAGYGRKSASDFKSPTTFSTTFQVGQAAMEANVASNCMECHSSQTIHNDRHKTQFIVDNCGACHDYQTGNSQSSGWYGAGPLSRRVHSIHFGSGLNYPKETVGYSSYMGWAEITLPQDVRNCETCHDDRVSGATASTAWMDNPNRVACMSCHDSDSAQQHAAAMTIDPTPTMPFSGDELESCKSCHGPLKGFPVANYHGMKNAAEAAYGTNSATNKCVEITAATLVANKVKVSFNLKTAGVDLIPCTADDVASTGDVSSDTRFYLAALVPEVADTTASYWVSYINSEETSTSTATAIYPMPDGTVMNQATYEKGDVSGTWTELGAGAYEYTISKDITAGITIAHPANAPTTPLSVTYNAAYTHRVAIQNATGANNAPFDFRPDGSTALTSRDIVKTDTCNNCHRTLAFHGGGRLEVEACVMCHNKTTGDAQSGNVLDMMAMVHKIHTGKDLPSVDYNTSTYSADGTEYAIFGYGGSKHDYSHVGFPPKTTDCVVCHDGTGADSANYKNKPWNESCFSCHDQEGYATGINKDGTMHSD
ncbi:MAG: OmcA/MtrC family decaheme c-type cytochrome, partial [Deltaproteobacteria bacterium]|nr:OmcA/MtrC family decaheme c-type cytochrome [Deltaproteobacteria bacterium]